MLSYHGVRNGSLDLGIRVCLVQTGLGIVPVVRVGDEWEMKFLEFGAESSSGSWGLWRRGALGVCVLGRRGR